MHLTEERELTNNSWFILERNEYDNLAPELLEGDIFGGRDCGWVSQMRPFIRAFSSSEDLVLDPFAGLGTTLVAAIMEGRNVVGVEIEAKRIELINKRLSSLNHKQGVSLHRMDAQKAFPEMNSTVDLSLTSIPYFGASDSFDASKYQGQTYSSLDYQSYLGILDRVFSNIKRWLKKDKFAIFMCENLHLQNAGFVPLAWDVARILQQHFVLCDERIICYEKENGELGSDSTRTNRSHEYVLICRNSLIT